MRKTLFALLCSIAVTAAAYSSFTLVRVENTNGGLVCVYSNGQHTIRQFRPYSAGYCPFNPD